jgi:hypothetical protein
MLQLTPQMRILVALEAVDGNECVAGRHRSSSFFEQGCFVTSYQFRPLSSAIFLVAFFGVAQR